MRERPIYPGQRGTPWNSALYLLLQSPTNRPSAEIFGRGVEIAQHADKLGFDSIWCAEHHFSSYGLLSRTLMVADHIAAKTERIRIGSAVVVLPLHNPLIVAEEIATVDILSGGRLDVGWAVATSLMSSNAWATTSPKAAPGSRKAWIFC